MCGDSTLTQTSVTVVQSQLASHTHTLHYHCKGHCITLPNTKHYNRTRELQRDPYTHCLPASHVGAQPSTRGLSRYPASDVPPPLPAAAAAAAAAASGVEQVWHGLGDGARIAEIVDTY